MQNTEEKNVLGGGGEGIGGGEDNIIPWNIDIGEHRAQGNIETENAKQEKY